MQAQRLAENFLVLPGAKVRTGDPNHPIKRRLTGFNWLPNKIRNHFIAFLGEFVGTFLFLFFAFTGTQIANAAANGQAQDAGRIPPYPNVTVLMYISLSFAFSLAVNVWIFFRISGGLFNPAVCLPSSTSAVFSFNRILTFVSQPYRLHLLSVSLGEQAGFEEL
jgi:aquaporin rerated protein, other eukaryote